MELSARSYGQKDSKEGAAVRSFRRSNDDGPACSAKEEADRLRPTKATDVFCLARAIAARSMWWKWTSSTSMKKCGCIVTAV